MDNERCTSLSCTLRHIQLLSRRKPPEAADPARACDSETSGGRSCLLELELDAHALKEQQRLLGSCRAEPLLPGHGPASKSGHAGGCWLLGDARGLILRPSESLAAAQGFFWTPLRDASSEPLPARVRRRAATHDGTDDHATHHHPTPPHLPRRPIAQSPGRPDAQSLGRPLAWRLSLCAPRTLATAASLRLSTPPSRASPSRACVPRPTVGRPGEILRIRLSPSSSRQHCNPRPRCVRLVLLRRAVPCQC